MKRSELTVGAELYCAPKYDWDNGIEGYRSGKAKVLAVEPYKKSGGTWGFASTYHEASKGNGVFVEIDGRKDVVPLAHLRGAYEDGVRRMKELRDASRNRRAEEVRDYEARRALAETMIERASRLGVTVTYDGSALTITPDNLGRLLDLGEIAERSA